MSIRTSSGILTGKHCENGITEYLGVPYAKAPVGERRFRRPMPEDTPQAERSCTTFAPSPIQMDRGGKRPDFPVDEDCLYLNLWVPDEAPGPLPVMVWFYGGGFNAGRSSDPTFDGSFLASQGVILVTVSYRIGVLGFLAHEFLAKRDPEGISGNYGIYDQICALAWIQNNISAFRGDPSRVTIFGQSAGGISCRIHLASPLSDGLFQRAVIESGGGLNEADPVRPIEEAQAFADQILREAEVAPEDLLSLDAFELSARLQAASRAVLPQELFYYQPVLDGKLLSRTPGETLSEYGVGTRDVICGTVSGDAWMFCRKVRDQVKDDPQLVRGFSMTPFLSMAQNSVMKGQKKIRTFYFERTLPEFLPGVPVPPGPKRDPSNRTPHTAEIPYVFGTLASQQRQWTDYDARLSKAMTAYWSNFAKTGDPNGEGLPVWSSYTRISPLTMHFTDTGWKMESLPENESQQAAVDYTIAHPGMLEIWRP